MNDKARAVIENVLIGMGLLSFWPRILGYHEVWYTGILLAVLVMLGVLAVVRYRRVRRMLDAEELRLQGQDRGDSGTKEGS